MVVALPPASPSGPIERSILRVVDDDAPPLTPAPPTAGSPTAEPSVAPAPPSRRLPTDYRLGRWPFGIVAVAILRLLDAAVLIIVTSDTIEGIPVRGLPLLAGNRDLTVALDLTYAALVIIGVIGLLLLRRWGWVLTMVLVGVALAGDIIRFFVGEPAFVGMFIHVIAAFYLNGRSVRALAYRDTDNEPANVR
jgi:hypothetical protein